MHWNFWFLLFRSHRCCYLLRTCEIYKERFHFLIMSGAINIESWKCIIFKRDVVFLSSLGRKYRVHQGDLCWGYLIVLWLFRLVCILYCGCLTSFVTCGCLVSCVGVVVIRVHVFTVFCIVCTVFLYCSVYVYLFLFITSVRTAATEWKLNCNNNNNNNNNMFRVLMSFVKLEVVKSILHLGV
jgi:hypothetical protein